MAEIWLASTDESEWGWLDEEYATREAAIRGGKALADENDTDVFYVGVKQVYQPHISADWIIGDLQDKAHEACGEWAEDFLTGLSKLQVAELEMVLNDTLKSWMVDHKQEPEFYLVEKVERHEVDNESK